MVVLLFPLLSLFASSSSRSDSLRHENNTSANHALFESVTGDSADEDRALWDAFYKSKKTAFGTAPIGILREFIALLPRGRAFVPAMGEGRNAIFLAKNRFQVEGVDFSEVAVTKAITEAKHQNVTIKGTVANLRTHRIPEATYDLLVLCLFYDRSLLPAFKRSLKKGGMILIYEKLIDKKTSQHDPAGSPEEFAVRSGELKEALKDFDIKTYREYMDQGMRVAAIVARKP